MSAHLAFFSEASLHCVFYVKQSDLTKQPVLLEFKEEAEQLSL